MADEESTGDFEVRIVHVDEDGTQRGVVKASRETRAASVRTETVPIESYGPGEMGVVFHGWDDSGPQFEITGGEVIE
jgi:hypothetical protein